jgi:hypothetical protein
MGVLLSGSVLAACASNPSSVGGDGGAAPAGAGSSNVTGGSQSMSAAGTAPIGESGGAGGTYAIAGSSALGGTGGSSVSTGGSSGGGTSTGGASSGGASGGPGSGGATGSGCAGKTYKLCEDFESGTVGGVPTGWMRVNGYGAASPNDQTLASDQAHSGSMALKSVAGTKGTSRIEKSIASLGATTNKHWGRIWYKVQSPAASLPTSVNNGYLHITFVGLQGMVENRVVDTVEQATGNKHQWLFNNSNDKGGASTGYDWTFDAAWHCAEWYVDVSTESFRFFSDSVEVTQLAFMNKADSQIGDYTQIIVGTTYYQDGTLNPPFTAWFDDLAIDDAQIHCN